MIKFGDVDANVVHEGIPPFQSVLILRHPPTVIIVDLIDISTLGERSPAHPAINNSDKGSGNTLL